MTHCWHPLWQASSPVCSCGRLPDRAHVVTEAAYVPGFSMASCRLSYTLHACICKATSVQSFKVQQPRDSQAYLQ